MLEIRLTASEEHDYKRFNQLWEALVTKRTQPASTAASPIAISNGMSPHTAKALADYGKGNKTALKSVKTRMVALATQQ